MLYLAEKKVIFKIYHHLNFRGKDCLRLLTKYLISTKAKSGRTLLVLADVTDLANLLITKNTNV